jgi:hypothetical protein
MARKPSARKAEQAELDEFAEKYEIFSSIYGDPVEALFDIMSSTDAPLDLRARCAVDLMSFRFPKLKALENKTPDTGKPVQFTINLVTPDNKPRELDVTPSPPVLKLAGQS